MLPTVPMTLVEAFRLESRPIILEPRVPLTPLLRVALTYSRTLLDPPTVLTTVPRPLLAIVLQVLVEVGTASNVAVHPLRPDPLVTKPMKLIVVLGVLGPIVKLAIVFTKVFLLFPFLLMAGKVKKLRLVTGPPLGARLPRILGLYAFTSLTVVPRPVSRFVDESVFRRVAAARNFLPKVPVLNKLPRLLLVPA